MSKMASGRCEDAPKPMKPIDPSPTPWDHSTWGFYCDTCETFFDLVRDGRVNTHEDNLHTYEHKACAQQARYIGYDQNAKRLASLPVGESTREPDVEPDTTIPHTSQELGEIFGKVFKPAKPETELGLGESREPLPPPIVMKGVMCGHPDCPCTGGYLHDPKDLLPSVPAEIESQMINLRELAATAFRENGHSHAGMGELLGCQDCADVQSAGIKLTNTMRDWLPKLLADSTRTQEKP